MVIPPYKRCIYNLFTPILNGNTKLLKCHFIFTKLSIGSNKVVVLSTTNFKPEVYFSSLLCHSNCMRFSTLDELLFYLYPVLNLTTTIHYTHKKITRISFKLYTNPNHIKWYVCGIFYYSIQNSKSFICCCIFWVESCDIFGHWDVKLRGVTI